MKGFCPQYLENVLEDITMIVNVLTEQYVDIYLLCLDKDSQGRYLSPMEWYGEEVHFKR